MAESTIEDQEQQQEPKDSAAVRVDKEGLVLMADILRLLQTKGIEALPASVQPDLTPSAWGEAPSRARVVRAALRLLKQDMSLRVSRAEAGPPPSGMAIIQSGPPMKPSRDAAYYLDVLDSTLRALARESSGVDPVGLPREQQWVVAVVTAPSELERLERSVYEALLDVSSPYSSGRVMEEVPNGGAVIFIRTEFLDRFAADAFYLCPSIKIQAAPAGNVFESGDEYLIGLEDLSIFYDKCEAKDGDSHSIYARALASSYELSVGEAFGVARKLLRLVHRELARRNHPVQPFDSSKSREPHPVTRAIQDATKFKFVPPQIRPSPGVQQPITLPSSWPMIPERFPSHPQGLMTAAYGAPGIGDLYSASAVSDPEKK